MIADGQICWVQNQSLVAGVEKHKSREEAVTGAMFL